MGIFFTVFFTDKKGTTIMSEAKEKKICSIEDMINKINEGQKIFRNYRFVGYTDREYPFFIMRVIYLSEITFRNCDFPISYNYVSFNIEKCRFVNCKVYNNIKTESIKETTFENTEIYRFIVENQFSNLTFKNCRIIEIRFLIYDKDGDQLNTCNKIEFENCSLCKVVINSVTSKNKNNITDISFNNCTGYNKSDIEMLDNNLTTWKNITIDNCSFGSFLISRSYKNSNKHSEINKLIINNSSFETLSMTDNLNISNMNIHNSKISKGNILVNSLKDNIINGDTSLKSVKIDAKIVGKNNYFSDILNSNSSICFVKKLLGEEAMESIRTYIYQNQ